MPLMQKHADIMTKKNNQNVGPFVFQMINKKIVHFENKGNKGTPTIYKFIECFLYFKYFSNSNTLKPNTF